MTETGAQHTHVWRSQEADWPCTPTGRDGLDPDGSGRIYAEVVSETGATYVPKEQIIAIADWKAEQAKSARKDQPPSDLKATPLNDEIPFGLLEPDRNQIEIFVEALFRYAGAEGYVSVRAFFHDNKPYRFTTAKLTGGLRHLIDVAEDDARRAANNSKPVVFCPPIAVFNGAEGWRAREEDLVKGLALSVECDKSPDDALNALEEILGPATVIVKSGGQWVDPDTMPQDKLHLHWRLNRPAVGDQLNRLKQARRLAAAIVGADTSSIPTVHCLRWPGSWHRKGGARMCQIARASPDEEIDLDEALVLLEAAAPKASTRAQPAKGNGHDASGATQPADWGEHTANIVAGTNLHKSITELAAKYARSGTPIGAGINQMRALMEASAARQDRPEDWKARFDYIPRAFDSAYAKYAPASSLTTSAPPPDAEDEPPSPPPVIIPEIRLKAGEIERVVNETEAALIAQQDTVPVNKRLFRRSARIFSIGVSTEPTHTGGTAETQVIVETGDYALTERIASAATFIKYNVREKKDLRADPPQAIAATLKQRLHQLKFPPLVAVVNCPQFLSDGQIMATPGYNPKTGIFYDPRGVTFLAVPRFPTAAQVTAAVETIKRLYRTFAFEGEKDRAVALSLLLTLVSRTGMATAPLHGFDAAVAGSGKSKLVTIASFVATGHDAGVIAQGETREEFEKRLATQLMKGKPLIAIDNCNAPLDGDLLNQALTQGTVEMRVLGESRDIEARCATAIAATGNNLTVIGDLTRRSLKGRLDPKVERPELQQFDYNPVADARDNRGEIVAAALTILRAFHTAGRPGRLPQLQSFEEWSDTVRSAIAWTNMEDPVKTQETLRDKDPVLTTLIQLACAWRATFADETRTVKEAIADAELRTSTGNAFDQLDCANPLINDALMAIAGRQRTIHPETAGKYLAKSENRIVRLENGEPVRFERRGTRKHGIVWILASMK